MRIFRTGLLTRLRIFSVGLLLTICIGAGSEAATVTGKIGRNESGGPFEPGFVLWQQFGSSPIGDGVQLCYQSCADHRFDFTETGMTAWLYGWSRDEIFNGFVFEFGDLASELVGVALVSTSSSLTQSNILHSADAFAIDLNGWVWGAAEFSFQFAPTPQVPVPPGLPLFATALLVLGVVRHGSRREALGETAELRT